MDCPVCGKRTGVYKTVATEEGYIRWRKCSCGYRFRTNEVYYGDVHGNGKWGGKRVKYSIVRCNECEKYIPYLDGKICGRLGSYFGNTNPDDFCSRGVRKYENA